MNVGSANDTEGKKFGKCSLLEPQWQTIWVTAVVRNVWKMTRIC